jgi:hypothetical protein
MEGNAYLDFDLRFRKHGGGYRAEIVAAPSGSGQHAFHLPFQEHELENYLLKIGQRRSGMRKADSPENRAAREFGNKLFDTVFCGELETAFWKSLETAKAGGNGLRIRLRLGDTPELADLPWEYLYQQQHREFLALSAETPIVRYFELPETVKPLAITPPLRVLVMLSNPSDVDCLDIEKEWQKLKEAVAELEERKLLIVERLRKATLGELQARLRKETYHVFHFVGHGSFDPVTEESVLALEDENGRKRLVSGPEIGIYLRDEPSLRLVILNACEGARASRSDPFSGAAQSLVLKGIPAVIAMQFEVSDEAAIALASGFYSALADDYPVDAAVAEARKAVFAAGCSVEWGTPVLYLRAPDGRIFDVKKTAAQKADEVARKEQSAAMPPPLPPLPVVQPQAVRPLTPFPAPHVTLPEQTAARSSAVVEPSKRPPRRWVWLLAGLVGTFVALVGLGFWQMYQARHETKEGAALAPTSLSDSTPSNNSADGIRYAPKQDFGPAIPAEKTNASKSREAELADIKNQIETLSSEQQKSSKLLDGMDAQAKKAIAHIKSDDRPEAAGTQFQPAGSWWKLDIQQMNITNSIFFDENGYFEGTTTMNGSSQQTGGTWSYSPDNSTLTVTFQSGYMFWVPLRKYGNRFSGFYSENGLKRDVYLERQAPR